MEIERSTDLVLSRFLVKEFRGDQTVVFNNLNPSLSFVVPTKEWRIVSDDLEAYRGSGILEVFRKAGLLIGNIREDDLQLSQVRDRFISQSSKFPSTLYLVLTDQCNLKCTYCPFSELNSSEHKTSKMDLLVAKEAINFWSKSIPKNYQSEQPLNIIFYGGEPLLNFPVIENSIDYINELKAEKHLPENTRFLLDTNGVLLSDSIAQKLKKWGVDVTVALDGFSEYFNKYRINSEDKNIFKEAINALELLRKYEINTYLSMMLTPKNYKALDAINLNLQKYNIKGIGMNIFRGTRPQKSFSINTDEYSNYQDNSTDALVNFFWQNLLTEKIEFQTNRRFSSFISKQYYQNNCGGFGEHVVVFPNGEIGNCPWSMNYNIGNIFQADDYSLIQNRNFLFNQKNSLPLYNEQCLKCEAISICGGNCIWANDQFKQDQNSLCILSKKMISTLVWKYKSEII